MVKIGILEIDLMSESWDYMSFLDKISDKFRLAAFAAPSQAADIEKLLQTAKISVPLDYIELIREKSELEFIIGTSDYVRIWGADGCLDLNAAYHVQEYLPNSLAIGDDGGGGALLYLLGEKGFGLYLCRFADLEVSAARFVAGSLAEFLCGEIGADIFL